MECAPLFRKLRFDDLPSVTKENWNTAGAAFDNIADAYDDLFSNSAIGLAQRAAVWSEIDRTFQPGQRILEINCGTGIDALHLASRGIHVVSCDASPAMIAVARRRCDESPHRDLVRFHTLAAEQIAQLESGGPFDGVLSNFAGLNCVPDLRCVGHDLARLLRPGARAVLCLFGRWCLWEMFWFLIQGDRKKAFRRLQPDGARVVLGRGGSVRVRYPSVESLQREFISDFQLQSWMGVGIAIPPSYLESLAIGFPRLFRRATQIDARLGRYPGFRALADHVVLTLVRSPL